MRTRIASRINRAFEGRFPELRVFLKSDAETRFIRLSPTTQVAGLAAGVALFVWAGLATAILMIDTLGAGSGREQAMRDRATYEAQLDAMARDRAAFAAEAAEAERRFALAMTEVSAMQGRLLASEELRREAETGLEVVQATLSRAIRDRDAALAEATGLRAELTEQGGEGSPELQAATEAAAVLDLVAQSLAVVAAERDIVLTDAQQARAEAEMAVLERRLLEDRNAEIFGRLEQAVQVSMEPLDAMFRSAGLRPDDVLREVRRGAAPEASVATLRFSSKGDLSSDEARANTILDGLDRMALYKEAVSRVPFANPVRGNYRFTSGFGFRRDPKTGRGRMHEGTDFAGARGTPILATADGVVVDAGWDSGYGQIVRIRHALGIETHYAHLSRIHVSEGQRVSRGDRIGDMGNTGRSTGTHLHYEVRIGGAPVNPMTYIKAASNVF